MTELDRLKVLSALKLGYGKLTAKNTTEKEFENIEQAIEIVKNLTIPRVVFNEANPNTKEHQEKLLREMMQNDEELGLYSEVEFCECDGVQDLIAGTGECRKCGKECTY